MLLVGLETEHITAGDLDHLDALLSRYPDKVQYIVGSVHHVNEIPIDFDRATFEKALQSAAPPDDGALATGGQATQRQMEAFLAAYLDAQYELLTRFRPEIVGHIDLCRLYHPILRFADYPQAYAKLQRNIDFATSYGALFELNAAALRKGWTDAYPGEDVAKVSCLYALQLVATDTHRIVSACPSCRRTLCALRRQPWSARCGAELSSACRLRHAGRHRAAALPGRDRRAKRRRSPCACADDAGKLVGTSVLDKGLFREAERMTRGPAGL